MVPRLSEPTPAGPEPMWSIQELAAASRRDEDFIRSLIHGGDLVANRLGGTLRVPASAWDAYLARTRVRPVTGHGLSAVPA